MIRSTNVSAQKIYSTIFETYKMVLVAFSVTDKADRVKFFEKTFLVANISPDVLLGIFFFILSGIDIDFLKRELW